MTSIKNRRLIIILITAMVLLLLPLTAMQFTTSVQWSFVDFIVAGALLLGTGLVIELFLRWVKKPSQRIIAVMCVLLLLLLTWAELAVGIFGTPLAGS